MRVALSLVFLIVLYVPMAMAGETISGLWQETSTPDYKSSHVIFSQDGEEIVVTCYWEFKGQKVVWHGHGTRRGKQVVYTITHTVCPPDFAQKGEHKLTISPDGKTMTGKWSNARKESGPLKFVRKK
jgi:hypothetical protein